MGVLIEDKEFDGTQCGEYDPDTRTAYIDPTMSMEQRVCTLQHELIHAKHFDDGLGLLSREKEERLTRKETAFSLINPIEYMRTEDLYGENPTRWRRNWASPSASCWTTGDGCMTILPHGPHDYVPYPCFLQSGNTFVDTISSPTPMERRDKK
jgi:hypothetical protein